MIAGTAQFRRMTATATMSRADVVDADLTQILADLDAINGEVIGTTAAEKTDKIEATKLAIETVVETTGVDVPALTPFADYPDYVADAVALAKNEALFNFRASDKTLYQSAYNNESGGPNCIIPNTIGGITVENIGYQAMDKYDASWGAKITALTLPAGLKRIEGYAFRANAIANELGALPSSLVYIGNNAFQSNLISGALSIPASVTTAGHQAFLTNKITSLTFAASTGITILGQNFIQDNLLTYVEVTSGIVTLGLSCFQDNLITETKIAPSVTTIEQYVYRMCPLVKIIIGASVDISLTTTTMGNYGDDFTALYNSNGKLAGTYEYAAGTWSKTA